MVADHSQTTTVVGESLPHSRANSVKGPKAEYDAAGSKTGKSQPQHSEASERARARRSAISPFPSLGLTNTLKNPLTALPRR